MGRITLKEYRSALWCATAGFVKFLMDFFKTNGMAPQGTVATSSESSSCGLSDIGAS